MTSPYQPPNYYLTYSPPLISPKTVPKNSQWPSSMENISYGLGSSSNVSRKPVGANDPILPPESAPAQYQEYGSHFYESGGNLINETQLYSAAQVYPISPYQIAAGGSGAYKNHDLGFDQAHFYHHSYDPGQPPHSYDLAQDHNYTPLLYDSNSYPTTAAHNTTAYASAGYPALAEYRLVTYPSVNYITPQKSYISDSTSRSHTMDPFLIAKSKLLSATSPEFVPRGTNVNVEHMTSTSSTYPSGPTSARKGKEPEYMSKLKTLIKEMPPNITSRRPFPSGHQGNQAYEPTQDYSYYYTPNYQDSQLLYEGESQQIGYPITAYGKRGINDPEYDFSDFTSVSRHPAYPTSSTISTPKGAIIKHHSSSSEFEIQEYLPIRPPHSYLTRKDMNAKDIIITSTSITRNIVRVHETYDEYGAMHKTFGAEFKPGEYDFVTHLNTMTEAERRDFWECNWVEIVIDFRTPDMDMGKTLNDEMGSLSLMKHNDNTSMLLEQLKRLGPSLAKYAWNIYVLIQLPIPDDNVDDVMNLTHAQETSAPYRLLEDLVLVLDEFKALKKMEVILSTAAMSSRAPLLLEHINYFLPFFDLEFQEWETKWQAPYMTRAEAVMAWPLTYLDRERHKINMKRWNEKKAKEFALARAHALIEPAKAKFEVANSKKRGVLKRKKKGAEMNIAEGKAAEGKSAEEMDSADAKDGTDAKSAEAKGAGNGFGDDDTEGKSGKARCRLGRVPLPPRADGNPALRDKALPRV